MSPYLSRSEYNRVLRQETTEEDKTCIYSNIMI